MDKSAEEARAMEFALVCPNDGRVDLGLEDISSVVIRDNESIEVVFCCPHCGTSLRATMRVPEVLAAAMELESFVEDYFARQECSGREPAAANGPEGPSATGVETASAEEDRAEAELRAERERAGEPYCEYFRRQLSRVESVEDLLQEID